MSRKKWTMDDFDKYMKPMHLAGKQVTLTIMHIGVETVKSRKREFVIAGNAPEEQPDDLLMILHFREYPKPLRLNNMNRAKLREMVGSDPAALIGRKVTLRPVTLKQFGGQEAIDVVTIEKKAGNQPAPQPEPEEPQDQVRDLDFDDGETPPPPRSNWTEEIDEEPLPIKEPAEVASPQTPLPNPATAPTAHLPAAPVIPSKQGPPHYGLDPKLFGDLATAKVVNDAKRLSVSGNGAKSAWDSLHSFALTHGFAVGDTGQVNDYQLSGAIWSGGFPYKVITAENVQLAKAALVKHYMDKPEHAD